MYHINRSQVEKHCMETSVCLFFLYSLQLCTKYHCDRTTPTHSVQNFIHRSRIYLYTYVYRYMYVKIRFIADQAVQGKLKYGLLSVFFCVYLIPNLFLSQSFLERHNIKLGYKIIDKRTQLFKTSLPFFFYQLHDHCVLKLGFCVYQVIWYQKKSFFRGTRWII